MNFVNPFQETAAMRVALDFDFNVFFYILLILIFILLLVITIKLFQIKNLIENIQEKPIGRPSNEEVAQEPKKSQDGFYVGQLVLRLKDEGQMRVEDILPDGKVVCRKGFILEEYQPSEIADFKEYWEKKKSKN